MGKHYVKPFSKKNGKKVKGHWRPSNKTGAYGNGHMSDVVIKPEVKR